MGTRRPAAPQRTMEGHWASCEEVTMTAACSPPWRVGGSREEDITSSPAGPKLGSTDTTPERPFSRNTASPEDSCPICLGAPENKSFTDNCFHTFCFACIVEWAKVKAECPLCKQRFRSIIHSIRSLEDYDECFVSELQRAQAATMMANRTATVIETYDRRFRFPTTMTIERRQEMEAMRQEAERRTRQLAITAHRNRYLPRGAITSAERLELYIHGLWAVPHASHYREASPEFYRDNPACTHRLVPWLNREMNALMQERHSHIMYAMDYVILLIMEFDIRHPEFARRMEASLHEHTEHFVHEFYSYATSVHDMAAYDQNTVYKPHHLAFAQGNPINRFRQSLLLQAQVAAAASRDELPPIERDSPQPGPSGLAVAREEVITTAVDTDSDSSDCFVVKVVKPQQERTPVVINILSSDEDDMNLRQEERLERLPQTDAGLSHSNWLSTDDRPCPRDAAIDSSSSGDEHLQRRRSRTRSPGYTKLARDTRRRISDRESSSQFAEGRQRQGRRFDSTTYALESRGLSSDGISTHDCLARKRKNNLVQGENHEYLPETDARPSHSNWWLRDRTWGPQRRAAIDPSLSRDERPSRRHARDSRSVRDRRRRTSSRRSSSGCEIEHHREAVQYACADNPSENCNSASDESSAPGSWARRKPKKLVSVVGAVSLASKSPNRERHHSHRHRHHHHHRDQKGRKRDMKKHVHRRRSPSQEF